VPKWIFVERLSIDITLVLIVLVFIRILAAPALPVKRRLLWIYVSRAFGLWYIGLSQLVEQG
jgi:hypothetical protein